MRHPIGSRSVSASGGNAELIGRRGEPWPQVASAALPLAEALALLDDDVHALVHEDPAFDEALSSEASGAARFATGEAILWRYGRYIETARVIRDDERGLVVWIPSGSARLQPVPADGRAHRDVPLEERFRTPWVMQESAWRGPGVLRVAPTGKPWSLWFFRRADGTPDGVYVNLELPHRRIAAAELRAGAVFTRDLVLDLMIDAEHPGSEDVWLKDADELEATVAQGRFTPEQAEAVRALADHAGRDFLTEGLWPLDEGWDRWEPDASFDAPLTLPDTPAIAAARRRSGSSNREG